MENEEIITPAEDVKEDEQMGMTIETALQVIEQLKAEMADHIAAHEATKALLAQTIAERDEAHNAFLRSGKEREEEKERDYKSTIGEIV